MSLLTQNRKRTFNKDLVLALLVVWDQVPDQRFGQFVMNLSRTGDGFADPWNWDHAKWYSKLADAAQTWAKPEASGTE